MILPIGVVPGLQPEKPAGGQGELLPTVPLSCDGMTVCVCSPLWQIFQAQGSHSFLVCGVIFGCLAFTFYILLLFFHRMHPELSSGKERICVYTRGGKWGGGGSRERCPRS